MKFSGREDTFVYNELYAAFSAHTGVLVVDIVNEIAFDIRESNPDFCGIGPIHLQGDFLAKFTSSKCLSVWNLTTGNRSDVEQQPLPEHFRLLFADNVADININVDKFKLYYLLQKPDSEVLACIKETGNNFQVKDRYVRNNQIICQSSAHQHWQPCRNHNEPTIVHNLSIRVNVHSICANWTFDDPLWRSLQLEAISLNANNNATSLATIEIADDWDANRIEIKNIFFTSTSMIVFYVHDSYYPPAKAQIQIFDFSP